MLPWAWAGLVFFHGFLLVFDEAIHRRRGLGTWERWGHPLDTMSFAAAVMVTLTGPWMSWRRDLFIALAAGSCLFITKDEPVHARDCGPGEHWVHAMLFVLHPVLLGGIAWFWRRGEGVLWRASYLGANLGFALYQVFYWNFWKVRRHGSFDRQ
jgi:hypothetical protein